MIVIKYYIFYKLFYHPYKYIVTKTFLNEYLITALMYYYTAIFYGIPQENIRSVRGIFFRNNCCFQGRRHGWQKKQAPGSLLTYCMHLQTIIFYEFYRCRVKPLAKNSETFSFTYEGIVCNFWNGNFFCIVFIYVYHHHF